MEHLKNLVRSYKGQVANYRPIDPHTLESENYVESTLGFVVGNRNYKLTILSPVKEDSMQISNSVVDVSVNVKNPHVNMKYQLDLRKMRLIPMSYIGSREGVERIKEIESQILTDLALIAMKHLTNSVKIQARANIEALEKEVYA